MSGDGTMTTQELLELASLDALGLLDTDERNSFEEAFRKASPAIQAQVRREQGRLSDVDDLLPTVDPPVGLRERVIGAVRDAIAAVSGTGERDVVASIAGGAWSLRSNVSPLWRAACIGFATAAVVTISVGYFTVEMYTQALRDYGDGQLAQQFAKEYGGDFSQALIHPRSTHVQFVQTAGSSIPGGAFAVINPEIDTAILVCNGLPIAEGEYKLVVVNDGQEAKQTIARFKSSGEWMRYDMDLTEVEPGASFELVAPAGVAGEKSETILTGEI